MTKDGILKERARELSWEGYRRNDMIRLGHYLDARIPDKTVAPQYTPALPYSKGRIGQEFKPGSKSRLLIAAIVHNSLVIARSHTFKNLLYLFKHTP